MTSNLANAFGDLSETIVRTEVITLGPAERLAGVFGINAPAANEDLPALWHWVYLLEHSRQTDLGTDGHLKNGMTPSSGLGRQRMFAGGRVRAHAALHFGKPATRTTQINSVIEKAGSAGPLIFVTVRNDIEQNGRLAIEDEQVIVYRTARGSGQTKVMCADESFVPAGSLVLDIDAVVLFRFSALTYNAHRIHYDFPYATQREGYSDLVVQGPLQALIMSELFRREGMQLVGQVYSYRLVAPAVGEQRLTAVYRYDGTGVSAQVMDNTNTVTATSTVRPLGLYDPSTAASR